MYVPTEQSNERVNFALAWQLVLDRAAVSFPTKTEEATTSRCCRSKAMHGMCSQEAVVDVSPIMKYTLSMYQTRLKTLVKDLDHGYMKRIVGIILGQL